VRRNRETKRCNGLGALPLTSFTLHGKDRTPFHVCEWNALGAPRAVVQIAHGLAEHARRYDELAGALNAAGYAVYANDHRGHGRTAISTDDLGFFAAANGWRACLDDLHTLRGHIATAHPGVPVILLGHSMGSFLAQQMAGEKGEALAGLVLSGSYLQPRALARAGEFLARFEAWRLGARGRSGLIAALTFGAYNRRFAPVRTSFDWLSRDADSVDCYRADPMCGFRPTTQLWIDLLGALGTGLPVPPKDIPVYLISGARDPVAAADPGSQHLAASFREAGILSVTHRVYPEARHELFHETNSQEVTHDLIAWLDQVVAR
jgi:alpha-beta hydrolase superfamily lysophospholipase